MPASIAAGAVWLRRHRDHFARKTGLRWAIEVDVEGRGSVGTVGLRFKAAQIAVAELGIVIARSAWGQGIGSAAARLVTEYAFTHLGLAEIQAEALQRNHASVRLLQKLGFTPTQVQPPSADEPETLLRYRLGRAPLQQLTAQA